MLEKERVHLCHRVFLNNKNYIVAPIGFHTELDGEPC